ncbi:hypothetical protein GCM10011491_31190 [Brucella endophytica]|uniref:Uncharacterized protein n=1 Tax=Brucella endophytica TaxID=1963359 RepID=A0A916WIL2_9HYPH|nr:hypothetical protein [Brucella endophytica]GGB00767.1 hypothetical protein GCM10011491_31190 [Brucella endophytica]
MTIARINATGVYLAKPGRQIEEGEAALAFSPAGAQQPIYDRGVVSFQAYNQGGPMPTSYNRAVVNFPAPFSAPPLCYCMGIRSNGAREAAFTMQLGTSGSTAFREPAIWWQSTTTALYIYCLWTLQTVPSASFVVTYNEAS